MRVLRLIFLALVALVLVTLAVTNRELVTVRLVPEELSGLIGFGASATIPLFVVILVAILAGVILGFIWEWFREHKYRAEAAAKRREASKLKAEVKRLRTNEKSEDDIIALLENR